MTSLFEELLEPFAVDGPLLVVHVVDGDTIDVADWQEIQTIADEQSLALDYVV